MNAILPFYFEDQPVRVTDRDGAPWFVLSDVCQALGIANVGGAAARLDEDERDSIRITDAIGRERDVVTVSESGVYSLTFTSRKDGAKRFKRWVTHDVLPAIRRTGHFGAGAPAAALEDPATMRTLLLSYCDRVIAAEQATADAAVKLSAMDQLTNSAGDLCITDAAKTLDVRPKWLFHWLMGNAWIYKREKTGSYAAYQNRLDARLLRQKVIPAGTLSIEIVAEIAKLQEDLRKVEKSIYGVERATKPANDNFVRMGQSGKLAGHHMLNLSHQINDVVVSLASGQKPMTVFMQQGAQIGGIMGQAGIGVGSALGGALGKVAGKEIGEALGGLAGKLGGPLGSIVGGVLGGVLGGMLSKTPWGRVNLSAQGASNPEGNSGASRRAAVKAGGSFDTALQEIADAFGGGIGDFGNITLGVRHGDWRVNATGTSLKKKKGATDFDGDAEGAIAFAIQIAIERGAITGIRESTQRLLKSSDDLKRNLDRALSFESVFKELASIKDPVGFAMDELTREFDRLREIFEEAGASAAEYADLEELLAIKRADILAEQGRKAVQDLSDRNSLEVELLRLLGKEEDALALARLAELASLEASLQPLQSMVFELQDARAVMDQFGPLSADLKAFRNELLGGSDNRNSSAFVERQFRETAALARDGNAAAIGSLRGTATAFLDAAKDNARSELEYRMTDSTAMIMNLGLNG